MGLQANIRLGQKKEGLVNFMPNKMAQQTL